MMTLLLTSIFITLLTIFLLLMSSAMNWKTTKSREKSSPYECGFDPTHNARLPFSLRFFLLITLFLIFDIEIALLVSLPLLTKKLTSFIYYPPLLLFLILLSVGLMHEWNEGSLQWTL